MISQLRTTLALLGMTTSEAALRLIAGALATLLCIVILAGCYGNTTSTPTDSDAGAIIVSTDDATTDATDAAETTDAELDVDAGAGDATIERGCKLGQLPDGGTEKHCP